MKLFALLFAAAAVLVSSPLYAAPKASAGADMAEDDAAAPKTGVRFVICSPDGATLPSPLFYKSGKTTYKRVSISSRTPSPRIRPEGGVVNFYSEDPSAAAAAADAAGPKKEAKLPEPVLSIPVEGSGKQLCIVVPNKAGGKPQTFFVKESAFAKNGMHIINFSSFPLRITTAAKPDFSDKKDSAIGVFHRDKGICEENTWTYTGETGKAVSFILSFKSKDAKDFKNFKASKFVITDRQSQINVVVKDPTRETLKLLSIQLADDAK
ncbi:MAG: hypothetical protein MJ051_01550 [Akkermansia sp.]|nr:hypothetical protein [Akkermansia sp.]